MRAPRVLLLFSPPADPAQPYSSLPTLCAFLRAKGCEVTMADLNIEMVHHLLQPEHLSDCAKRVDRWMDAAGADGVLSLLDGDRYLRCAAALGFAKEAPVLAPDALDKVRSASSYASAESFVRAVDVIDRAFQLVSAAAHPAVLSRHHMELPYDIWDPNDLARAVEDLEATPMMRWLQTRVSDLVDRHGPDVVGVSLTFADQLVPSLVMLAAVRAADPSIHTCLGGVTASRLAKRLTRLGTLLRLLNSVVVGEGEDALAEIAFRVVAGRPLDGVVNVIQCQRDGTLERGPTYVRHRLDDLPPPAYDGLDLGAYLVPEPVLIVNSSRACYWSKCSFCDVSGTQSETYRQHSIDQVVDQMVWLRDRTGARHFIFGDLSINPRRLKRLAGAIERRGLDFRWLCEARLEDGFNGAVVEQLAAGGCRGLVFGFESASQRMLDRMAKGTRLASAEGILKRCDQARISVNLQTFIGFPGETEAEARETLRFAVGQKERVTSVALTSFKLIESTAAYEDAGNLGLLNIRQAPDSLDVLWDFDVETGLSQSRAAQLVREFQTELRIAYPIIEKGLSWNAHALLLVARSGPDGLRLPPASSSNAGTSLRLRPGLRIVELPFHVGDLARAVRDAVPADTPLHARCRSLSANVATVARRATRVVVDRCSSRLVVLDDPSYRLMREYQVRAPRPKHPRPLFEKLDQTGALLRLMKQEILVPCRATATGLEEALP